MLKTLLVGVADDTADTWSTPAPSLIDRIKAYLAPRPVVASNEVEDFIHAHGGVLTDNLEREISRKFGGFAGNG